MELSQCVTNTMNRHKCLKEKNKSVGLSPFTSTNKQQEIFDIGDAKTYFFSKLA